MSEHKTLEQTMWKLCPGGYCGVYMPTHVMKKVVKEHSRMTQRIRDILTEHKAELHAHHWTMSELTNPVYIDYTVEGEGVEDRINLFKPTPPERVETVYVLPPNSHEKARDIARELKARS